MKFYAFNDSDDSSTVNLLLDHNTTDYIAWNSTVGWKNDNDVSNDGPITLLEQLHIDTDNWNGTETPKPNKYNFISKSEDGKTGYSYNIDYSGYNARLIIADEVAKITGNDIENNWISQTGDYYYFDTHTYLRSKEIMGKGLSKYKWLYDRIHNCEDYGCDNTDNSTYRYWTSSGTYPDSDYIWNIYCYSGIIGNEYYINDSTGLRPVITVLKSKLS